MFFDLHDATEAAIAMVALALLMFVFGIVVFSGMPVP